VNVVSQLDIKLEAIDGVTSELRVVKGDSGSRQLQVRLILAVTKLTS